MIDCKKMDIFSYEAKIKTFLLLFLLSAVDERGKSMARGQMNSAQIERCLGFLGQKLADMQINAKIILLGGAVMVTQLGNRNATQDIDAVIATNDRQVYQAIQQAIAAVAREKKLAQAWLNDDVTIVVDQVGKPKAPRYWKTYGSLDVYIPELEYILALKLFSGRPQDYQDIQALAQHCSLQTQEQAWSLVHRYIPKAHNLVSGSSTQQMPSTVAFSASIYSVTD